MKATVSIVQFKHLPKIVGPLFSFVHGNADQERGFSVNKRLMTSVHCLLSITSLNGLCSIEDDVRRGGGVTISCIIMWWKAVRNVANKNRERLEADRRK